MRKERKEESGFPGLRELSSLKKYLLNEKILFYSSPIDNWD